MGDGRLRINLGRATIIFGSLRRWTVIPAHYQPFARVNGPDDPDYGPSFTAAYCYQPKLTPIIAGFLIYASGCPAVAIAAATSHDKGGVSTGLATPSICKTGSATGLSTDLDGVQPVELRVALGRAGKRANRRAGF